MNVRACIALPLLFFACGNAAYSQDHCRPFSTRRPPESVQDLLQIETHVQKLVDKVMPATVCLRIGNAQGSGVIIDHEGHILTAGHVSGKANVEAIVVLPDGRRLHGKTLGANNGIDSRHGRYH